MADAAPVVSSANRLSITAQTVRVMRRWVRLQSPYGLPSTHPASSPLLVVTLVPQGKQHRTSSCAYAHATPPSTWRRQICADPQHHRHHIDDTHERPHCFDAIDHVGISVFRAFNPRMRDGRAEAVRAAARLALALKCSSRARTPDCFFFMSWIAARGRKYARSILDIKAAT